MPRNLLLSHDNCSVPLCSSSYTPPGCRQTIQNSSGFSGHSAQSTLHRHLRTRDHVRESMSVYSRNFLVFLRVSNLRHYNVVISHFCRIRSSGRSFQVAIKAIICWCQIRESLKESVIFVILQSVKQTADNCCLLKHQQVHAEYKFSPTEPEGNAYTLGFCCWCSCSLPCSGHWPDHHRVSDSKIGRSATSLTASWTSSICSGKK